MTFLLTTLAYRPFLEPLPIHDYWMWLIIPLAFVIALVYRTLKLPDLSDLPIKTLRLTTYIIAFMIVAAIVLYIVVQYV